MPEPVSHTLEVPDATLTYDVRGDPAAGPPLFLFGSPMDASGFGTLASHFTDRAVVTYDPRGTGRSARHDGAGELVPSQHADDLHRVVDALGAGPVDVFATSGGAVNATAWIAAHPQDVRTAVLHEPPSPPLLPDAEPLLAAVEAIHATYERAGSGAGMAQFIALVSHDGPLPDGWADGPAPDPAMFGLPTEDDGARGDPLLGQNLRGCNHHRPDVAALRAASTRIVPVAGATSGGQMAARGGRALAAALGVEVAVFPGDHTGFLGGEFGMTGEPDAFAARLRELLG